MGWCYGDLGIASVLLCVARRVERNDWLASAISVLNQCLGRFASEDGVVDTPLCHGAVGVAHMYNRIYQTDGDPRCRDASIFWFKRALNMIRPGEGVGGVLSLVSADPKIKPSWSTSSGLLDGAVGVALGFLAGVTNIEPIWDCTFLLSNSALAHRGDSAQS